LGRHRAADSLARLSSGRQAAGIHRTGPLIDRQLRHYVANIKSQIKRIRTNEAARQRNKSVKSALKTAVRSFRTAADAGDKDRAGVALTHASRQLDKAVSKGVIHANQAANKKAAMAHRANSL
jgi:small subunit ribosomal protein S20